MAKITISTPRGTIISDGKNKCELTWNPSFGSQKTQDFNRRQAYIDSEVLRYCSAMVPLRTGMLEASGRLGTVIGSGEVQYIAPYSAPQYYNTADSRPYDGQRGAHWFERMKAAHKDKILQGAQKM